MATSRASIPSSVLAAAVALALPACGRAQAPAAKETRSMTIPDTVAADAKAGEAALAARDYKAADIAFDRALAALDDTPAPGTIDDTGMQMVLARSEAAKGNWEAAAKTKAQVLRARLAQAAR